MVKLYLWHRKKEMQNELKLETLSERIMKINTWYRKRDKVSESTLT